MAYKRLDFTNRSVEKPRTYNVTENADGSITLRDAFGEIYAEGTPLDAANMNYLEDGIAACGLTKYAATTTYDKNELALDETTGKIYVSQANNNKGTSLTNPTYWKLLTVSTLETPRKINGTNFDGSTDITTNSWGTARNISIANSDGTGAGVNVSVDGSTAVSLKLPNTIKANVTGDLEGNADTSTKASTINNNRNNSSLKFWTGTLEQYNTLSTKDDDTLYNITDDQSDTSLTILEVIYPVGSLYMTTNDHCPLSALFGTWQKVSGGKALWISDSSHAPNTTIEAGLPNITGTIGNVGQRGDAVFTGAFYEIGNHGDVDWNNFIGKIAGFDAHRSNSLYGNSDTVQPPAYVINVFRRTA